MYKIKKAPESLLKAKRNSDPLPLQNMKIGEMVELENTASHRMKCYNHIKKAKDIHKSKDWVFAIRTISKDLIACVRLS